MRHADLENHQSKRAAFAWYLQSSSSFTLKLGTMRLLLYLFFLMMVKPLRSFNVDTGKTWITPHTASLLWPTVLQHSDGNTTMILATSSADKGLGRLRKCTVLQEEIQCQEIPLRGKIKGSKNIQDGGIAIDRNSDWILACLQKKHRRAFTTTEDMNGVCTLLTTDLRSTAFLNLTKMVETKLNTIQSKNSRDKITDTSSSVSTDHISSACGELFGSAENNHMCKELGTEIAVILGGSENTKPDDFQNAKISVLNMMKSMWQKCSKIRFAVVQYGAQIQTELSLQESCNRLTAFFKVRNIKQQSSRTDIAATLQHVLDKVFDESRDSSQTGDKIIIVLASGQVFLENHRLRNVMNSLEMAMVKLYAPGIGEFTSNQWVPEELRKVVSDWFVQSTYEDFDSFLSELERETLSDSAENIPTEAPEHRNTNDNGDSKLPSQMEEDEEEEENDLPSGTEIAFILDGSGSIEPADFERAKAFIHKMMKTLYEKCFECNFAVVQYGFEIRTEFDLRENWDPRATLQKVLDIVQVCNVTKTASAMQHVLDSIFTESHGSHKDAAKVMIVLTDGEILLDEMNLTTVINSPKMAGIERYAIGVGGAFEKPKALNELRLIASGPGDTNVFQVTNYSALDGLLSTLQQSIIGIEGTQGDALEYELAQAGFSVQILDKQVLMFGAVGAFDWSGGILLYDLATKTAVFLNESKEEAKKAKYSYLGYSVAVVRTEYGPLYVAGAPRHSMKGKVLVFQDGRLKQTLQGEQVGSYFGSELCPVDVNHDGVTDLLLVGAPFYHIQGEEGRVYVYRLETETGSFTRKGHLNVQVTSPFARFGFTVASIGDINGDGYEDIAVGAPLEDQLSISSSFGSIYIFNGDKDKIKTSFSQRVKASEISSGLRYFGQSIDGGFDLTNDGLQDITVGSLENVVVLRSRPVVHFLTSMRFNPERILIFQNNSIVTAKLCFDTISALPVSQQVFAQLYILYTVDLDVKMSKTRVQFEDQNTTTSGKLLVSKHTCSELQLYTLPCDFDCFSSVFLRVKHELHMENDNMEFAVPVLDRYKPSEMHFQLPYKKDCNKTICAAHLTLTSQIQKEVAVGHTKEVTMNVSLTNSGDDSYMTTMVLNYPKNLHFKKVTVEPSSPAIHCGQPIPLTPVVLSCNCRIGHPVFKKTTANFSVIWQLDESIFQNKSAITVNITNINENSTVLTEEHILDVRYAFTAVLTKPVSLMYVNVSEGLLENKEFKFNINGENRFNATIKLQIWVPISIQGHNIITIKNASGTQETTECGVSPEPVPDLREYSGGTEPEGVRDVRYQCVRCSIRTDGDNITVTAELSLNNPYQFLKSRTVLLVPGEITFNRELYLGLKEENHRAEITLVFLKDEVFDPLPTVIGSCVGGLVLLAFIILLLWKCGFFKRNYKTMMEQEETS
ncbi:integrin alpha-E isoform X1 [Mycteria americana]|uniref:integrin alpha-E isoform X1 n=1 Tax=Mycteria americana TaxID=33587 RepID=UPI003F586C09